MAEKLCKNLDLKVHFCLFLLKKSKQNNHLKDLIFTLPY